MVSNNINDIVLEQKIDDYEKNQNNNFNFLNSEFYVNFNQTDEINNKSQLNFIESIDKSLVTIDSSYTKRDYSDEFVCIKPK